jgi:hypothetical protein
MQGALYVVRVEYSLTLFDVGRLKQTLDRVISF